MDQALNKISVVRPGFFLVRIYCDERGFCISILDSLDSDRCNMKPSQTANDPLLPANANIERRIAFAGDTLRSIQQLIQLLDQKSYLILVITGVTSTAFFSIVGS